MKVLGVGLLLSAVYVMLVFSLPLEIKAVVWAGIAGWQIGAWIYKVSNWFVNRYWR